MSGGALWPTIALAGLVTFLLRWSFIAMVDAVELPASLRRALRFVPAAVFSAIVWPAILVQQHALDVSPTNLRLLAALLAAAVAWRTRNVLYTIATGMLALWLLSALFAPA